MDKRALSERDICTKFITPSLVAAGWNVETQLREEVGFTDGRIYVRGKLHARGTQSRSGNVWDNAAMESFFSSLKTERTARKMYRSRDEAKADVFDYIERFYNPKRRHSTIGYMSPMEFERQVGLA